MLSSNSSAHCFAGTPRKTMLIVFIKKHFFMLWQISLGKESSVIRYKKIQQRDILRR